MSRIPGTGAYEEKPEFQNSTSSGTWDEALESMSRGDWVRAKSLLTAIDADEPGFPQVLNKIGVCLAEVNELDEAEAVFNRTLEMDSRFAPAMSNLGNIALQRGNAAAAADLYQKAIQMDPDYALAHHNLSAAYKRLGKIDKAVAELKKSRNIEMKGDHVRGYPISGDEPSKRGLGGCLLWAAVIAVLVIVILFLR